MKTLQQLPILSRLSTQAGRALFIGCTFCVVFLTPLYAQSASYASRSGASSVGGPLVAKQSQELPASFTFTYGLIDFPRSVDGGAFGISDTGKIVGGYNGVDLNMYPADHGFRLSGKSYSAIDYPGATQTAAYGINQAGEVVGMFVDSSGFYHGFTLNGSVFTQLDCPGVTGNTVATSINNQGTVVGVCGFSGFTLIGSTYTIISVPGAVTTWAWAANKAGVVVGYYEDSVGNFHGYFLKSGIFTTVDYPGYPNSYLDGITDVGVMLGGYGSNITLGSTVYPWEHGFLYAGGTFTSFDVPFGAVAASEPFAINNHNEIVGGYIDSAGMVYGFYAKAH